MKNEKWFAAEITAIPEASEAIEFALNELNSLGSEINNLGKKDSEYLTVIGYFNELPIEEILQNKVKESLEIYGFSIDKTIKIETKEIENQDWLAEWKKHWKPTVTNKFIISPPWENIESDDKIVIKIEPNMAFGTGTHETTKLCLQAIVKYYKDDLSFFDVGTGTGILAIAIAKLQGKSKKSKGKIVGCDIDFDSVKIAKENAVLNNTEGIEFYVGSITENSPKFDFVCANVTAEIIMPLLPLLIKKSRQVLVLSGILFEQKKDMLKELKKYKIEKPKIETDGEWISIVIEK